MHGITSHAWVQQQGTANASQITPSPPPSATSVSPTSCDEQDKTEQMLYIDNLKYYSAPCRNNSYLLPEITSLHCMGMYYCTAYHLCYLFEFSCFARV